MLLLIFHELSLSLSSLSISLSYILYNIYILSNVNNSSTADTKQTLLELSQTGM